VTRLPALALGAVLLASLTPTSPAHAADDGRRTLGVTTVSAPGNLSEIRSLARRARTGFDQVTWYAAWATTPDFPAADATRVARTGALPEITWEPWDPAKGTTRQPAYRLRRIASGAHDAYVRRWARQAKAYGAPVVIRLGQESNGTWYPWAARANGNRPADFVAAWRRVVGIFRRVGAANVSWQWSANVPFPGSTPMADLYPGDRWVDRVGLDGYNWGTSQAWSTWMSPAEVLDAGLTELRIISERPIYLSEIGSAEAGGDKAAWVRDLWAYLDAHPDVRGLTWFSLRKETDWRLDSSRAALRAYAAGARVFRG
jgi:hypothetical protein